MDTQLQWHHHIHLNALCTFTLAKADCRVQSCFRILLHPVNSRTGDNEFVVVPHKFRPVGPTTICKREWQGRASIYVGGPGGVGQRHSQSSTPLQCSESGITLSCHMVIIWLLIRPGSLFWFYGSTSFPPAFNSHTITSPKPDVSNSFVSNGETWWCALAFSSCRQCLLIHNS